VKAEEEEEEEEEESKSYNIYQTHK